MIDLHSHILPAIDDGAATLDESVKIARAAVRDGIRVIAATPHVREDYPTTPDEMERLVGELRDRLAAERIPLDVRTGGEIALDRLPQLSDDDLARFGLGGNPHYVLLEIPGGVWPLGLHRQVMELRGRGITPVLGHPERNVEVQNDPALLEPIVAAGALVQLTAASLDGRAGRRTKQTALRLLESRHAHLLASDSHSPGVRAVGLRAAADELADPALAAWLTEAVPDAIVHDEELPPSPERPVTRSRGWLRRAK